MDYGTMLGDAFDYVKTALIDNYMGTVPNKL